MKGEADAMSGFNESELEHVKGPPCGRRDDGWVKKEAEPKQEGFFKFGREDVKLLSFPANGQTSMEDSYFIDQH